MKTLRKLAFVKECIALDKVNVVMHRIRKIAVIAVALGGVSVAQADPITYEFTGLVNIAGGSLAGQGSNITGSFSFDDELVDLDTRDGFDLFQADNVNANSHLLSGFTVSFSLGDVHVAFVADIFAHLELSDGEPGRQYAQFIATSEDSSDLAFSIDLEAVGLTSSTHYLDGTTNGAINFLDAFVFDTSDAGLSDQGTDFWFDTSEDGVGSGSVTFFWTGISRVTAVPEPGTLALLAAGLFLLVYMRRRRFT